MDMMFIHADADRAEVGVLTDIKDSDIEICIASDAAISDNSFSFTLDEDVWAREPITNGHYIYAPGTEFGGLVSLITHNTSLRTVTLRGATWRGMLFQKVIEPPAGEAYKTVNGIDANAAILAVVGATFGDMMTVSSSVCGTDITAQWRYDTYASGLHKALAANGLRLAVVYNNVIGAVILSAEPVVDYSDEIDLSQDYGVDFTTQDGRLDQYNRCIGLGRGELTERMVASAYRVGDTYYASKPAGWTDAEERSVVLDYPNVETSDELMKATVARLREFAPEGSISIDQVAVSVDVELGDIVGARDRLTGMVAKSAIIRKILTVRNGELKIEAKAG